MLKKICILTGNELRHQYFRIRLSNDSRFNVLASFCEDVQKSLANRVNSNPKSHMIEKLHVKARAQSEIDFFSSFINISKDLSKSKIIKKGEINKIHIIKKILKLNPDLLICYGSSLINSVLLEKFKERFINVHLGLSPYYRGAGTNIWPLINLEPQYVGATFMFIDAGIDTGRVFHQIRADYMLGDSPHSLGNRLIIKMTKEYCKIIDKFDDLKKKKQINLPGKIYYIKDFDFKACNVLYENLKNGLIYDYLKKKNVQKLPIIIENEALR